MLNLDTIPHGHRVWILKSIQGKAHPEMWRTLQPLRAYLIACARLHSVVEPERAATGTQQEDEHENRCGDDWGPK